MHLSAWPTAADLGSAGAADGTRSTRSQRHSAASAARSRRPRSRCAHELARVEISGPEGLVSAARLAADDLRALGKVTGDLVFTTTDGDELKVAAELSPPTG